VTTTLNKPDDVQGQDTWQLTIPQAAVQPITSGEETAAPSPGAPRGGKAVEQSPAESVQQLPSLDSPEGDTLHKLADQTLYWKIELRISSYEQAQGIEVPLGRYVDGQWTPYEFIIGESSVVLNADDLAYGLVWGDQLGCVEIEDPEEAKAATQATMTRCLALTKASATNSRKRSRRGGKF